jgi:hypothetical protein
MARTKLTGLVIVFAFFMTAIGEGAVLWSSDFESPNYVVDEYLTGQQGWWYYQVWPQGKVVSSGTGQYAKMGAANGYAHVVLTPWISTETISNKRFRILMTVQPGSGSESFLLRVMDNHEIAVINISFDSVSGHILAKGGDNADWVDSNVAYTSGTDYRLEVIKNDSNWTFALKVNGIWILRNIPTGNPISMIGGEIHNTNPGIGYLYILGGGNNGTPNSTVYTYLDNLSVEAIADFDRVWSADFESPSYTVNSALTSQQGWWHYQNWVQGLVVSTTSSQRAQFGGPNGYSGLTLSPWITAETEQDMRFRILMTVQPGSGNDPFLLRIMDNNHYPLVNVGFDQASGHIRAKGTDSSEWIDTGIAYTPGADYRLEIVQDNQKQTFNLFINSCMVLRNIPNGTTASGFGYLYILGGGNNGVPLVPITNQYTYIDDVSVDILTEIETFWWGDFESPPYVLNSSLTGQQGWWYYQSWSQGQVVAASLGQRAQLGYINGYSQVVLSPWITTETIQDIRFRIRMMVQPGNGNDPFLLRILDTNQYPLVNVGFDQTSGHIRAKGTDSAEWIDTGVAYTPGTDHRLEVLCDNKTQTFSLCINDFWILRDITFGVNGNGIGYLYLLGGGNNGVPIANQYTYLDDLSIQVIPNAKQYAWPVGPWDRLDSDNGPATLASEGGNITVGYHYGGVDDLQVQSWLDQAYLNGLRVIVETPRDSGGCYISSDTTLITNYINKFKKHPAVFGWYISDEPSTENHTVIKAGYDLIKSLDNKPIFICFNHAHEEVFDAFADSYDIMLYNCYATGQGEPEFYLMTTSTFQGRIDYGNAEASAVGKPWWVVLQGWGRSANTQWLSRLPTTNELKFMVYYSIAKNACGWLSWCQFMCEETFAGTSDPYPYDGNQWIGDVLKPMIDQVHTLGPALNEGIKSGLTDNENYVLSHLYQDPETLEYYILAVNNYNGNKSTILTISSSVGTFVSAQPLFEGRSAISISNRVFSDQFSRYQVHVYKLIPQENSHTLIPGDANGDGMVDVGDLGILASNYGIKGGATWELGDFNDDKAVDIGDLGILAAHYGEGERGEVNFDADYAKAFGTSMIDEDHVDETADLGCSSLGLLLIAGLFWIGMLLVGTKLKA